MEARIGRWNRFVPLLAGLLPAALLLVLGYTGSFSRALADDFCAVRWTHRLGLFRSLWYWYIGWNGRFSSYAFDWLVMLPGPGGVSLAAPLFVAAWAAASVSAIFIALRRLQPMQPPWPQAILLGLVSVAVVLTSIPSLQTGLYWWSGMRLYTLPLLFLTIYLAVLAIIDGRLNSGKSAVVLGAASLLYCLLAAGFSEVYAVLQLGLLGLLALASLRARRMPLFVVLGEGIMGTLLALVIMALSPGNRIREAQFPPHPGILRLLEIAGQSYVSFAGSILFSPEKVLALAGALLAAAWVGANFHCPLRQRWLPAAVLGSGLLLSFGVFLPTSWGLSEPPPDRILSIPVWAITVAAMAAAFIVAGQHTMLQARGRWIGALAVAAIAALSVSGGVSLYRAYRALPAYTSFAERWDEQQAQILAAKASGEHAVEVTAWPNWAGLNVLSDNPKNWLNQCISGYYGIQVRGREPAPTTPGD